MATSLLCCSSILPSDTRITKHTRKASTLDFFKVVRDDGEFIKKKLEFVGKSTRPIRNRISRSVGDFFWLHHLEDPTAVDERPRSLDLPQASYSPGMSGLDLLMADLEALKVYANSVKQASRFWSMPLPEVYDQQKVAEYFNSRPHILMFRMLEVFSSFASATIKLQAYKNFRTNKHEVESSDNSEYYTGHLLKESMLNLGSTFIKIGQSLSTRPDIIGSEISKALSVLHDKIPPFPREVALKIIEDDFGCSVDKVFSFISEEPVAAASFGQVYQGSTLDGSTVAIKVQRPDMLHAVVLDVYILRLGLALIRKITNRKNDICLYADELGRGLVGELDYTLEAANAAKFLALHSQYSFMSIPKVFKHLTRKRVLTMEWVSGESPRDLLLRSTASNDDKTVYTDNDRLEARRSLLDLVNKGVEASLVQLLETGLLHADPHPGNLRYTPEGRIGFLDFGLICQMEKKHQFAMLAAIIHIVNGDWNSLVHDLTLMDVIVPGINQRRVTMDLENSLGEVVFRDGIPDIKFSKVVGKILSIALKYQFRMPPYFTLLLRSLASLEGLAVAADPDFKTFQAAYPYVVQKLLYDNSAQSRAVLYSVIFDENREFVWQKVLMFLRVGSLRKGSNVTNISSKSKSSEVEKTSAEDIAVANQLLRLLTSRNGTVLRRLLITVNSASLARAITSSNATEIRQYFSQTFASVIYRWTLKTMEKGNDFHDSGRPSPDASISSSATLLQKTLEDRRVRVIFYKIAKDLRRRPLLMIRACWCCFTVFATASAIALHRLAISWSNMLLSSASFMPKRSALFV